MKETTLKPWEMGVAKDTIPDVSVCEYVLVRVAPPKKSGSPRDGMVNSFLMTSYTDANGDVVETIKYEESADGYKIEFPKGKRDLLGTKFRGPKNYYRFLNRETKQFYEIPQENYTVEYAEKYLAKASPDWNDLTPEDKDQRIDEYLEDMFLYGLSQDLILPIEGEGFISPFVGLKTKLYRVVRPKKPGEQYANVIVTKWHKGYTSLDGAYESVPEALATALYEEWAKKETTAETFDPTTFEEDEDPI